ncbi:MAG: helix-turn-helix domain-containing protein [Planctomycetales bacterium]|nr:helix-turn-helix domain-containing protein [Planctomycetales bacterium]
MSQQPPPSKRSHPCNGDLLRSRRFQREWTQEQLAAAADLSVRLIAKAESNGRLRFDTLALLASVLSTSEKPLYAEDLISDPKALALEFIDNLREHQGDVVSHCRHFLDEDIVFFMPGDPSILPFAGRHVGIEAMDRACRIFFETLEVPDLSRWVTEFVVCDDNQVIAAQWIPAQLRGLAEKGIDATKAELVVYRMVFQRGKIVHFDDQYSANSAEAETLMQRAILEGPGK